jgi:hypothetical protein
VKQEEISGGIEVKRMEDGGRRKAKGERWFSFIKIIGWESTVIM